MTFFINEFGKEPYNFIVKVLSQDKDIKGKLRVIWNKKVDLGE